MWGGVARGKGRRDRKGTGRNYKKIRNYQIMGVDTDTDTVTVELRTAG
jgi:hypothetical protein